MGGYARALSLRATPELKTARGQDDIWLWASKSASLVRNQNGGHRLHMVIGLAHNTSENRNSTGPRADIARFAEGAFRTRESRKIMPYLTETVYNASCTDPIDCGCVLGRSYASLGVPCNHDCTHLLRRYSWCSLFEVLYRSSVSRS